VPPFPSSRLFPLDPGGTPSLAPEIYDSTSGPSRPASEDFSVLKLICEVRAILFLNKKRPGLAVATGLAISLPGVGAP
jgi:hypothetical protein